jgi:SulP family sulfate permease
VHAYELYGSLFFGAATKIEPLLALASPENPARVLILDMRKVLNVDTTGLDIIETLHGKLTRNGKHLIIAEANEQPMSLFRRSGFAERLGDESFVSDFDAALDRARAVVQS